MTRVRWDDEDRGPRIPENRNPPSSVIPADAGTHGHGALANDGTATMGLGVRRDDVKCASEERRGEERRGEERRGEVCAWL
jgi:hypothetical protein